MPTRNDLPWSDTPYTRTPSEETWFAARSGSALPAKVKDIRLYLAQGPIEVRQLMSLAKGGQRTTYYAPFVRGVRIGEERFAAFEAAGAAAEKTLDDIRREIDDARLPASIEASFARANVDRAARLPETSQFAMDAMFWLVTAFPAADWSRAPDSDDFLEGLDALLCAKTFPAVRIPAGRELAIALAKVSGRDSETIQDIRQALLAAGKLGFLARIGAPVRTYASKSNSYSWSWGVTRVGWIYAEEASDLPDLAIKLVEKWAAQDMAGAKRRAKSGSRAKETV